MNDIAVITLCNQGTSLAREITAHMGGDLFVHTLVDIPGLKAKRFERVIALSAEIFSQYRSLIYIMPTGVANRALAPLITSKYTDPAVVVMDVLGRYAISLLSGHEGGANALSIRLSNITGAEPVITTTTEVLKEYTLGIGCKKNTPKSAILELIMAAVAKAGITTDDLRYLATIDVKATEAGILDAAAQLDIPLRIIKSSDINNTCYSVDSSEFVRESIGVAAVAEPCALLSGRRTKLILKRIARNGVTVALAKECCE